MVGFTEGDVEDAALSSLQGAGWQLRGGSDIAFGEAAAERTDPGCRDVLLERSLRQALAHLNPDLPAEALEEACRKFTRANAPTLIERNRGVHRMLVNGVTVEHKRKDGSIAGDHDPGNNEWLAVNQLTIAEGRHTRAGPTWCCSSTVCRLP